jgi:hypothetical protein
VPDAEREVLRSPAAGDGVDIASADTTGFDFDVHVVVAEGFWGELYFFRRRVLIVEIGTYFTFVEGSPCLGRVDLKSFKCFWVHGDGCELVLFRKRAIGNTSS